MSVCYCFGLILLVNIATLNTIIILCHGFITRTSLHSLEICLVVMALGANVLGNVLVLLDIGVDNDRGGFSERHEFDIR